MKYIILMIGLLVVGCGKTEPLGSGSEYNAGLATDQNTTTANPVKELTLREKVIGTYELKENGGTYRWVFLANGIVEYYTNGKNDDEGKWSISEEGEMHVENKDGDISVGRINKDGSITNIATIYKDGKRTDKPKEEQDTVKKIK